MQILSRLRLRTKLAVLMGLSALALVASIGVAASLLRQRMIDDRIDKLAAVVNTTIGVASSLETQIAAHQLTREQAVEQFRNAVHALRFDGGTGYVTAWTSEGIVLAHGTAPALENKPTPVADSSGRTVRQLGEAALRDGEHGVVSYAYPRPGQTQPKPKVAYAARAGQRVEIALTRFCIRLAGTVAEKTENGMHITFVGDGFPADQADRISLTTIGETMRLAKDDHVAFVKRVADAVAGGQKLPPESLSSPHHCRFGVWYDDVSDTAAMAPPSFKAIKAPHEAVHELGRRALVALGADDAAAAQRCAADMRNQSEYVLRCLDEFGRDYPKTFAKVAA
jgi:hypothetical protein